MMRAEVSDAWLRAFVVGIGDPGGGGVRGTGVLVAPGWALTCAHVVEGLDDVRLVPAGSRAVGSRAAGGAGSGPVPAFLDGRVRARSASRDLAAGTAFWPFPDLALIEFGGWPGHPFAPLALGEPGRDGDVHAWGFGTREPGVAAVGSPASFRYVGTEDDGFYSLKSGDATPGLSGAPLACPGRRGIVGVMSVSRDPHDARGGWASPAAALAGEGAGELSRLGAEVTAANRSGAWRHRNLWNLALPVPGADQAVDQPWRGVGEDRPVNPSTMLRAEFGVVGYLPRDDEVAAAAAWCDAAAPMAIRYIDAPGGAGKSRYALEVCRERERRGWVAGLLGRRERGISEVPLPRLVVVDYAGERGASELADLVAELTRSATAMTPVRMLLLSRPVAGQQSGADVELLRQQESASGAALAALDAATDDSRAVAGFALTERGELYRSALAAFGRRWHGPDWSPEATADPDLSADRYARPLDVLLEAFDAALSGPDWRPGLRPPVERALDHEERHWHLAGFDRMVLRRSVALASLAGARDDHEARDLLGLAAAFGEDLDPGSASRLDRWLHGRYDGPDWWNPLLPDRLAEALIARSLRDADDGGLALLVAVLGLPSDAQVERALDVAARLAADPQVWDMLAGALVDRHGDLVRRAAAQAHGSDGAPGRSGLLDGLARAHVALLTDDRLADLPPSVQRRLSLSFDELGNLARDYGHGAEAEAIFRDALAIDQRKLDAEPGNTTYRRDLSVSFERLADLALAAGRSDQAEDLYRRSLRVREELADAEPGNTTYRRDLSVSFNKLADLALAAGRSDQAEDLYRRSLQVAEELADAEPGNTTYRRDLSVSFNKLADLALAAGRSDQAEDLYRRALRVREELADAEPGNTTYRRDLSISFERLADLARRAGDHESAWDLAERAIGLRRSVRELEPAREDVAVEFAYALYLAAEIAVAADRGLERTAHREEAIAVLTPFEAVGILGPRGRSLLGWARGTPGTSD